MSIEVKTSGGVKRVLGVELSLLPGDNIMSFDKNGVVYFPENLIIPSIAEKLTYSTGAIYNHPEVKKITIAPRNTPLLFATNCLSGCSGLEIFEIPNGVEIQFALNAGSVFAGCASLTNEGLATILGHVYSGDIGDCNSQFYGCTSLTEITIPYTYGDMMFRSCTGLKKVTVTGFRNAQSTYIASDAFLDCSSLEEVHIPDETTIIRNGAFGNCSALKSFVFPSSLTTISNHGFSSSGLIEVELPSSVSSLASGTYPAFNYCTSLKKVTLHSIPGSSWGAWNNPFANCTAIEEFIIPSGWTENLWLSMSNNLTHDTLVGIIGNLYDYSSGTAHTLTIGETNLAKLSAEEIAVATGKGWTVS